MPVRLKDIAQHLGISITTVSRALGGYSDVADETRRRVEEAALEMGYYPDASAQKLQKQRTDTIGFIIPTFGPRSADPFWSEVLAGLANEASQHGMDLLVATHPPGPSEIETYQRWVGSRRVDGFILVRTRKSDARIRYLSNAGALFVAYGRSEMDVDFPYVGVDGQRGMYVATRHLIGLGHRHIAYIAPPPEPQFSVHRLAGIQEALQENGASLPPEFHLQGNLTQESGYRVTKQLLALEHPPTAILCGNDLMALGAISAIQETGLAVGRDLSVSGFDDIAWAAHSHPSLTTVRQPVYEIGRRVCRMLIQRIRQEDLQERHIVLQPKFVVRESTGPAT